MSKSIVTFFFLGVSLLNAASISENNIASKLNNATINTLMIFTSQEGLNSGTYFFRNTPVDLKMEILHLPFKYHFKSDTNLNYFIVGNAGYSKISLDGNPIIQPDKVDILNKFNSIQTYTAGLGAGIRYQLYNKLYFSLGAEVIYSRSGVSVKDASPLKDIFNSNYSNNLTYKFFALAEYRPIIYKYKPYITLGHKLYETKSSFTIKDIVSFDSTSSVTTVALGVESAPLYSYNEDNYLSFETYFNGHILDGIVKDVINVKRYGSFGAVAYWNTIKDPWWVSRYYLEASVINADGLEGYNVGVGLTLDF